MEPEGSLPHSQMLATFTYPGSSHHGMAHPQVEDGGTASNMEGSCEYIE
jgi:hypothetical protein